MVQLTFKDYVTEGQVEHQHIKRVMDTIAPEKRPAARKAYHAQKSKGQPHASSLAAMRVFADDVEHFDEVMLAEVVVVSSFPTIQKAIKDSHTPPKKMVTVKVDSGDGKTMNVPGHLTGKTRTTSNGTVVHDFRASDRKYGIHDGWRNPADFVKEEVEIDEGWTKIPATPHKGPMKRGDTMYTHDFVTKVNDPKNRQIAGVKYLRTADGTDKTSGKAIPKGHHLVKFSDNHPVTKQTGTSLHWLHPDHIFKDYDQCDATSKFVKD